MTVAQLEAALKAEKTDRGLRLVLPADSLFQSKQGELDTAAATPLTTLAALVAAFRPREIVVIGHTDSVGDDAANLALSKQRAHAVAAWLSAHERNAKPHFITEGFGRTRPVAPNHNADGSDNPTGRAANRRIEILLRRR
jgi:outer membrane protein OmpA-like peptidoglycan-associated protein